MTERTHDSNHTSSNRIEPAETEYAAFEDFTVEEWHDWLVAFLSAQSHVPRITVEKEEQWHQILIRIFDRLTPKGTVLFNEALFKVFENTSVQKKNERQLYTLLHVIAYSIPGEAKQFLRRRLREGIFRGLKFGQQDLHSLLLLACSKYHVDEALAKYVQRSARISKDIDYLLLCQWVLSTIEGPEAFYFNERLIPVINSPEEAAAVARQLTSISERLGYSEFLTWYQARSLQLERTWGKKWELFVDALRQRLLSDASLPFLAVRDRDAVLLYTELRIKRDRISLLTILKIARLHTAIDPEQTGSILSDIWKDLYQRTGEVPWRYYGSNEKGASSAFGTLFLQEPEYLEERFSVISEPLTEKVLIEVRNHCEASLPTIAMEKGA